MELQTLNGDDELRRGVMDKQLRKELKLGRMMMLLTGVITLAMVCGVSVSVTQQVGSGEVNLKLVSSNDQSTSANLERVDPLERPCIYLPLWSTCNVELCPKNGHVDCFGEQLHLNAEEVRNVTLDACDGYEDGRGCQLKKNVTVLLFTESECGYICKILL